MTAGSWIPWSVPIREVGVPFAGSNGFNTEPRDSPNEPQARPPGGFPSAFNKGSPIEPSIESLSRVDTRTLRGVPKGHSGNTGAALRDVISGAPHAGVENIDITVADNKVVVTGAALDSAALVEKVAKSGKATELWA